MNSAPGELEKGGGEGPGAKALVGAIDNDHHRSLAAEVMHWYGLSSSTPAGGVSGADRAGRSCGSCLGATAGIQLPGARAGTRTCTSMASRRRATAARNAFTIHGARRHRANFRGGVKRRRWPVTTKGGGGGVTESVGL
jgi:hypothetical protein